MTILRAGWVGLVAAALIVTAPRPSDARMGGGGMGGGGFASHHQFSSPHGGGFGGHGFHGGRFHDGHGGPRFFFNGFFYDAFPFAPYVPYGVPYPYGYYNGPFDGDVEPPPYADESPGGDDGSPAPEDSSSYGLVQLRGVPDGAAIDLDHRFWLEAHGLDDRWLALPAGSHTVTVRVRGYQPVERDVDVVAGRQQTLKLPPIRSR